MRKSLRLWELDSRRQRDMMTPVDEEGDEDAGVGTRAAGAAGAGVVKKEQNRPKLTVEASSLRT